MAYNVIPYKKLDFVDSYLCNWFSFNPLSKIFDGDNEVFHLA